MLPSDSITKICWQLVASFEEDCFSDAISNYFSFLKFILNYLGHDGIKDHN
jgi:hypothetical protein